MNTHPITRKGEPRTLYVTGMIVQFAGLALMTGACIAVIATSGDLWMLLGGVGVLLVIASGTLQGRAFWHLSREEQEASRRPLWVGIVNDIGFFVILAILPVAMFLANSLYGVAIVMIALFVIAGFWTARTITHRKEGTRGDRVERIVFAVAVNLLALSVPAWAFITSTPAVQRGDVFSAIVSLAPAVIIAYGFPLVAALLYARDKRRKGTTPA